MMEKVSLSQCLIATQAFERAVEKDFFYLISRYGHDDQEVIAKITAMQNVVEDVMGSMRHRLLKLEHELNTLNELREEEE